MHADGDRTTEANPIHIGLYRYKAFGPAFTTLSLISIHHHPSPNVGSCQFHPVKKAVIFTCCILMLPRCRRGTYLLRPVPDSTYNPPRIPWCISFPRYVPYPITVGTVFIEPSSLPYFSRWKNPTQTTMKNRTTYMTSSVVTSILVIWQRSW